MSDGDTKPKRRRPTRDEREAAALLAIKRGDAWLIPEPLRSQGTAADICAAVDLHHWRDYHALGGTNEPQNLEPMLREDHRIETATKTIPQIAKTKRIRKKEEEFRRKILAKSGLEPESPDPAKKPKRPWGSSPMPGSRKSKFKVRMTKDGRKVELRRKENGE